MTTKNFKVGTGLDIDGLVLTNSDGELFVNGNTIAVDLSGYALSNAIVSAGPNQEGIVYGKTTDAVTGMGETYLGKGSGTNGYYATAIGYNVYAMGDSTTVVGAEASATGIGSTVIGQGSKDGNAGEYNDNSLVLGAFATGDAPNSITLGNITQTKFRIPGLGIEWNNSLSTDDIDEGSTNLYFTDQKAISATANTYVPLTSSSNVMISAGNPMSGADISLTAYPSGATGGNLTLAGSTVELTTGNATINGNVIATELYVQDNYALSNVVSSAAGKALDYNGSTEQLDVNVFDLAYYLVSNSSYLMDSNVLVEGTLYPKLDINLTALESALTTDGFVQSNALIITSVDTDLFTTSNALLGINANAFSNALIADGDLVSSLRASGVVTGVSTDFEIVDGQLTLGNYSNIATKSYVDSVATGLDVKASVNYATVSGEISNPASTSPSDTVDGVPLSDMPQGARVLIKNAGSSDQNGIYVVDYSTHELTRSADANNVGMDPTDSNLNSGAFTFVESGTTNAGKGFVANVTAGMLPGEFIVTWSQFSETGSFITSVANTSPLSVNSGELTLNTGTGLTTISNFGVQILQLDQYSGLTLFDGVSDDSGGASLVTDVHYASSNVSDTFTTVSSSPLATNTKAFVFDVIVRSGFNSRKSTISGIIDNMGTIDYTEYAIVSSPGFNPTLEVGSTSPTEFGLKAKAILDPGNSFDVIAKSEIISK